MYIIYKFIYIRKEVLSI